jgi:hypothetical protein
MGPVLEALEEKKKKRRRETPWYSAFALPPFPDCLSAVLI